MINYYILLLFTIFLNRCQLSVAQKYLKELKPPLKGVSLIVTANEECLLVRCSDANPNETNYVEFNLKYDLADDMETLIINGNITVLIDLPPTALLQLHLNILKWSRGKWETTIYSVRRDDFCSSLFNPEELWYSLSKQIPMEDRICPPRKGTVYHMNDLEIRLEFHDVYFPLEGKFKVIARWQYNSYVTCTESIFDIWKK